MGSHLLADLKNRVPMIDSNLDQDSTVVAAGLVRPCTKARLTARGVNLASNALVSIGILSIAIVGLFHTAKNVRNGKELARNGRLAYTADVQAGGRHLATAYYSFVYDGRVYRGETLLPGRYLDKITDYNKSADFPVLFLPQDPSINHPQAWHDDEHYSSAFLSYVLIAITAGQWFLLYRNLNARRDSDQTSG